MERVSKEEKGQSRKATISVKVQPWLKERLRGHCFAEGPPTPSLSSFCNELLDYAIRKYEEKGSLKALVGLKSKDEVGDGSEETRRRHDYAV